MERQGVENRVMELADGLAARMDLAVVDVSYRRGRGTWILEVCLDRDGKLTLDDCAGFSRALGDVLDQEGALKGGYHLEVASPGLRRVLTTGREYQVFRGRMVEVTVSEPIDGHKVFTGVLRGVEADQIQLQLGDGTSRTFPLAGVVRTRLHASL